MMRSASQRSVDGNLGAHSDHARPACVLHQHGHRPDCRRSKVRTAFAPGGRVAPEDACNRRGFQKFTHHAPASARDGRISTLLMQKARVPSLSAFLENEDSTAGRRGEFAEADPPGRSEGRIEQGGSLIRRRSLDRASPPTPISYVHKPSAGSLQSKRRSETTFPPPPLCDHAAGTL